MKDWNFIFQKWVLGKFGGWRSRPESEVKRTLATMTGGLVIDVGANEGAYTVLLARRFAKVYAFEPNPKVLPVLRRNVAAFGNVTVFDKALSNKIEKRTLYSHPLSDRLGKSDTIVGENIASASEKHEPSRKSRNADAIVDTVTYDSVIGEEADLVKIDVEGAEFLVLEGMLKSLKSHLVSCLVIELHDKKDEEKLREFLTLYEFECRLVDPNHLLANRIPSRGQALT